MNYRVNNSLIKDDNSQLIIQTLSPITQLKSELNISESRSQIPLGLIYLRYSSHQKPKDEHAQILKCLCLIKQNQFDQLEFEQQGAAQELMNETTDKTKRIATSLGTGYNPIMNPISQSGRIMSGYQRPGTVQSRAGGRKTENILSRAGGNPITSNGRVLRLGTASLIATGDNMLNTERLELKSVAKKKAMSRTIWRYLFYVDRNLKRALELAAYATELADYKDPWWKVAIGKCYYHMGLYADARKQFQSSIKHNNNIQSYLYLSRLHLRDKQYDQAITLLEQAKYIYPTQVILSIHIARIHQSINQVEKAFQRFKSVLEFENCNMQAVASIAAYYFYKDQAEVAAAKLYQRLIELGFGTAEVWNNIGLCCFQSGKFELFYPCFERALHITTDELIRSDIWFNIGNLYVHLGNVSLAEMAFKTSLTHNQNNAQSLKNMAVINAKSGNIDGAVMYAERSSKAFPQFDSAYNLSIWYFVRNDIKSAKFYNSEALKIYPQHYDSLKLEKKIQVVLN